MEYSVELKKMRAQPTLSIHREVPLSEIPQVMQHAIPKTWTYADSHGGQSKMAYARYFSVEPTKAAFDVGVVVQNRIPGADEIQTNELPGGDLAYVLHVGPYETMEAAYQAIRDWMKAHGRSPAGAPWEVYLSDPTSEPDPANWKTEVYWPVAAS